VLHGDDHARGASGTGKSRRLTSKDCRHVELASDGAPLKSLAGRSYIEAQSEHSGFSFGKLGFMLRSPAVAGTFYPADAVSLKQTIASLLLSPGAPNEDGGEGVGLLENEVGMHPA
jgi:hypothetical protein